jgi:hypothetical protein
VRGGQDNVPALVQGWDLASANPGGLVVWIHGPQPVLLDSADLLMQRFLWRGQQTRLCDFQTANGPNRIAEKLDGIQAASRVARLGTVAEDLGRFLSTASGGLPVVKGIREKVPAGEVPEDGAVRRVSKHLARLWAFEEVARLAAGRSREAAVALAAQYQLVTPVSGAVVLETQQQFAQAGLEPVSAETVPSVPEPAALWWVGAALMLGGAGVRRWRSRIRV